MSSAREDPARSTRPAIAPAGAVNGCATVRAGMPRLVSSRAIAAPNDRFGVSLALSGELLIVGALNESNSASGINPRGDDDAIEKVGAVYVFR